jgi:peptidoglycan/LPS O-acetylase OafA/YrhL
MKRGLLDSQAAASAAPVPRHPRYQLLDHWRGLACLMVVMFHSTLYFGHDGGGPTADGWEWTVACTGYLWAGVPIFFVISGYCIAATSDSTRRRGLPLRQYFVRRVRRIYPPYWAMLVLATLMIAGVSLVVPPDFSGNAPNIMFRPWWLSPSQWFGNLTLTESWRHNVFGTDRGYVLGQAWTLCYEEQFYAVTGLLLLLTRAHFFRAVAAVSAIVLTWVLFSPWLGAPPEGTFLDGQWLLFAAGMGVYYSVNYAGRRMQIAIAAALLGGLVLSIRGPSLIVNAGPTSQVRGVWGFAVALILLAAHRWDDRLAAWRALEPLRWCGQMCYSLYLSHWPMVFGVSALLYYCGIKSTRGTLLVTVPVCMVVALVVARAFYLLVERRYLNAPYAETRERPAAPETGQAAPALGAT